jgi:hypothetical protein
MNSRINEMITRALAIYSKPCHQQTDKRQLHNIVKSATEKALEYVEVAPRLRIDDLCDNPGARTMVSFTIDVARIYSHYLLFKGRQVKNSHNQSGHTIGELQRTAKPPLGWVWGDFYKPWQRIFPGDKRFNGDIKLLHLQVRVRN